MGPVLVEREPARPREMSGKEALCGPSPAVSPVLDDDDSDVYATAESSDAETDVS